MRPVYLLTAQTNQPTTDTPPQNGYWKRWHLLRGTANNGKVQWEETWWEASDYTGFKEMGAEKKGNDAAGGAWNEAWTERLLYVGADLDCVVERNAHKWAHAPDVSGGAASGVCVCVCEGGCVCLDRTTQPSPTTLPVDPLAPFHPPPTSRATSGRRSGASTTTLAARWTSTPTSGASRAPTCGTRSGGRTMTARGRSSSGRTSGQRGSCRVRLGGWGVWGRGGGGRVHGQEADAEISKSAEMMNGC
jgi:hypothetical protein